MSIIITLIGRENDKILCEYTQFQGDFNNFRSSLSKVSTNKDRTGTYKLKGE